MNPLVSVVLLSYRRPHYLERALSSLISQTYPNLEILVIDNPSDRSGEVARIVGNYPQIRLICPQTNLGFTGGMNLGIEQATGDFIHLTEDDIVLDRHCIQNLVSYAAGNKSGLFSGIMYSMQKGTIHCAGASLRLGTMFRLEVLGQGERDKGQFPDPFEVDYIPGCMIFAARELWQKLGGFRDDFFMYSEDVELCLRARRLGHQISIVPTAKVCHFDPPQSPDGYDLAFYKLKNLLVVYVLHARFSVLIGFFFKFTLVGLLRSAVTDRQRASALLRANWVTCGAIVKLLRERRRLAVEEAQ